MFAALISVPLAGIAWLIEWNNRLPVLAQGVGPFLLRCFSDAALLLVVFFLASALLTMQVWLLQYIYFQEVQRRRRVQMSRKSRHSRRKPQSTCPQELELHDPNEEQRAEFNQRLSEFTEHSVHKRNFSKEKPPFWLDPEVELKKHPPKSVWWFRIVLWKIRERLRR